MIKDYLITFPIKIKFFESYLKFIEDYLLKKYGKEIVTGCIFYYLSDLEYETPRETFMQGLIKTKSKDMVLIKQRMNLTEDKISRILNEQKTIP